MAFSTKGYKRNSPDVNKKVNVIPSGDITMKGVDFKVKGTDNLGNTKIMEPGKNYKFPGSTVTETKLNNNNMSEIRTSYNKTTTALKNAKTAAVRPGNQGLPGMMNIGIGVKPQKGESPMKQLTNEAKRKQEAETKKKKSNDPFEGIDTTPRSIKPTVHQADSTRVAKQNYVPSKKKNTLRDGTVVSNSKPDTIREKKSKSLQHAGTMKYIRGY